VNARAEAQSISNASSGKGYNAAMGALLEEYGFGNALERHRSQVTRADLLRCMDYLSEIEKWRHDAKASVLLPVERHRKHRYPDHTVLNHPSVVWRQFKTSEDGKQAFKDRGIVPAKPRAPKPTADLKRDLDQAKARIEELEEELEAARFLGPVIETEFDVTKAKIATLLNGVRKQYAPLTDMLFPIDVIIPWISRVMTLLPGDVIATGTPAGVGPMKAGDVVEVVIPEIGTLRNPSVNRAV
jgi:hypothetical protein